MTTVTESQGYPAPIEPGLLVIAGVESLADADPSTGWPDQAKPRMFDKRALLQTQLWIDIRAVAHRVDDMSHDHRANVIEMLLDQAPTLMIETTIWLRMAARDGLADAATAETNHEALAALGDDWMERTPLVQRMRELNETRPLEQAAVLVRLDAPDAVTELSDSTSGRWKVTTEASAYLIDLDSRLLFRIPEGGDGSHVRDDGRLVLAFLFPTDGQWLDLVDLAECTVGAMMRGHVVVNGKSEPLRTTIVTRIEKLEPP